jgi:hypothetical protein
VDGQVLSAAIMFDVGLGTLRACYPLARRLAELGLYSGAASEWTWSLTDGISDDADGDDGSDAEGDENDGLGDQLMTESHGQPIEIPRTLVDIRSELPSRIADLYSMQDDLQFARNCAVVYYRREFADTQSPRDETHNILNRALWSAALTSYRRAFTTGRSFNPSESRFNLGAMREKLLSSTQQQAHDGFYEVANQHIMHRSSDRDRVLFHAGLNPPPLPRGVHGIGAILVRHDAPGRPETETFIEICDIFIPFAQQEIQAFLGEKNDELSKRDMDQMYEQAAVQAQEQQKLLEQAIGQARQPPP